ncbi:MAG: hypothetical protein WD098_06475 [Balneolales bacterium]
MRPICLLLCILVCYEISYAQSWNLPETRENTRFYSNGEYSLPRPALTVRGFDNQNIGSIFSNPFDTKVLGVKQILE